MCVPTLTSLLAPAAVRSGPSGSSVVGLQALEGVAGGPASPWGLQPSVVPPHSCLGHSKRVSLLGKHWPFPGPRKLLLATTHLARPALRAGVQPRPHPLPCPDAGTCCPSCPLSGRGYEPASESLTSGCGLGGLHLSRPCGRGSDAPSYGAVKGRPVGGGRHVCLPAFTEGWPPGSEQLTWGLRGSSCRDDGEYGQPPAAPT